ncbi:MAG: lipid A deacylase LpxR family protein [Psychromonas sp.]|nr:lipid A deacylase LpxR family protein [Alteromonadales bacterium]MCP5077708.1 lipid A deacylase LpxR family protein [Psychromonas sp.]
MELIHPLFAISTGIMANIYNFSVLYTLLRISDEYEGQAETSRFGSIAITYHF